MLVWFNKRMREVLELGLEMVCYVMILVSLFGIVGCTDYIESHYTMEATVVETKDTRVTLEDRTGNLWIIYGEDLETGDRVTLTFEDNHTETREDDRVVSLRS